MGIERYDDADLIDALVLRGYDLRNIREFSMTELKNEITRREHEIDKQRLGTAYIRQVKECK